VLPPPSSFLNEKSLEMCIVGGTTCTNVSVKARELGENTWYAFCVAGLSPFPRETPAVILERYLPGINLPTYRSFRMGAFHRALESEDPVESIRRSKLLALTGGEETRAWLKILTPNLLR
jgi:hypothetical protein